MTTAETTAISPLAALLLANTNAFNEKCFGAKKEGAPLSDKAAELVKLVKAARFDSSQTQAVADILTTITGEDISSHVPTKKSEGINWEKATMVVLVPIKKSGSHNYPLGEPTVIAYGDIGLRMDGTHGNHLPSTLTCYRPATEEDVMKIAAVLGKKMGY